MNPIPFRCYLPDSQSEARAREVPAHSADTAAELTADYWYSQDSDLDAFPLTVAVIDPREGANPRETRWVVDIDCDWDPTFWASREE